MIPPEIQPADALARTSIAGAADFNLSPSACGPDGDTFSGPVVQQTRPGDKCPSDSLCGSNRASRPLPFDCPNGGKSSEHTAETALVNATVGRNTADSLDAGPGAEADQVGQSLSRALTEYQVTEANRRLGVLNTFAELLQAECSPRVAARQLGESRSTIWRWQQRFGQKGFTGLIPDTNNCGRKSELERLGLSAGDLQKLLDETRGFNLDLNSTISALRLFAHSDRCPEQLAKVILDPNRCSKHAIPPSIRRAAAVSDNHRLAHRGPRALSLKGMYVPRRVDILPGDIFSADDTTPIWAWWVPWRECEEYPFGVKLLQGQFLPVIDVASQCVLTFVLIAREKSSYRAGDIWHLFGHTFETIGLPRLGWQLERGSWESNLIAGERVGYGDGEASFHRRVGGLRQLPTNITPWHREKFDASGVTFPTTLQTWTSYLPKSKSIEAWFNRSQKFEGTLWGSLGRDQMRAPFEKAKKLFQQCSRPRAKLDPRNYFLSHIEIANRIRELMNFLNDEPMEGEVFHGIPRQKFNAGVSEHPLFVLPEDQRWLYRRDWKRLTITQGWARVRLTDPVSGQRCSLFYCHPQRFAGMEGEDVVVYYDREHFEQPAQIVSARTGEFVCEADFVDRKGSFLDGDSSALDLRKQWRNAVMATYATIVPHAPSRQLPREIEQRREQAKAAAATPAQPTIQSALPPPRLNAPGAGMFKSPTAEEFARKRERLAQQAEAARGLREAAQA